MAPHAGMAPLRSGPGPGPALTRRHCLHAGAAAVVGTWPAMPAQALVEEGRLIDRMVMAGREAFTANARGQMPGRSSKAFLPRAGGGPVWVMFHSLAVLEGVESTSQMTFDVGLLNLPVNIGLAVLGVRARWMRAPEAKQWPRDGDGSLLAPLSRRPLKDLLNANDLALVTAGLMDGVALRQSVVIRQFPVDKPAETAVSVSLQRMDGLRPLLLDMEIGQGPVPREAEAFASRINGSWLARHAYEAAFIGTGVAAGAALLWRLSRR